jgi:hypothetical protein
MGSRASIEIILWDQDEDAPDPARVAAEFTDMLFGDPEKAAVAADAFRSKITKVIVTKLEGG